MTITAIPTRARARFDARVLAPMAGALAVLGFALGAVLALSTG